MTTQQSSSVKWIVIGLVAVLACCLCLAIVLGAATFLGGLVLALVVMKLVGVGALLRGHAQHDRLDVVDADLQLLLHEFVLISALLFGLLGATLGASTLFWLMECARS